MKKQHLIQMVLVFIAIFFLKSCSDETTNQMARVQFILVDAPGDYEEVNIDLKDVLINRTDENSGWESVGNVQAGVYNLLDYTGGFEALIADVELPAGQINQIRLLLGDNNSIKLEGSDGLLKLDTPSAQQSGLKLKVNAEILGGVLYTFILDFDADKSVVKAGNSGKYNLKPVIRVTTEALSGAISGKVTFPTDVTALTVTATNTTDNTKIYSTPTNTIKGGDFLIKGVLPGNYNLTFEKSTIDNSTSPPTSTSVEIGVNTPENLNPVIVTIGNITDVGTITFE